MSSSPPWAALSPALSQPSSPCRVAVVVGKIKVRRAQLNKIKVGWGSGPCGFSQLEDVLRLEAGEQEILENKSLAKQNVELRRRLEEDQACYKRKLQAYQEGQQRQAQLVQKLQAKVGWAAAKVRGWESLL